MWAPITVVGIAGGIYVYECVDTLLAPGTGFTMDYATPGGNLKIECASYNVDLWQQTVYAKKLVIKKENGTLVARVPLLVAKGITVDEGLAPKVQIRDAELWMNRDAKGDLDILKFLSPSEGGGSKQPWQISLRDVKVYLRDYSAPGGILNEVDIATGNFVGLGDNTEGAVVIAVKDLASGRLQFKKTPTGTEINGQEIQAKVAPILARLRAGKERDLIKPLAPLQIASGIASGDMRLLIQDKKPLEFVSNVTLGARDIRWSNYRAENLNFKGRVTQAGLVGSAKGDFQGARLVADGSLLYSPKIDFTGNVHAAGVTPQLLTSLKVPLPKGVSFRDAKADGAIAFRNGQPSWSGTASVNAPAGFGLKAPIIEAQLAVNQNQLLAKVRPVTLGNTVITANLAYNMKSQAIAGTVSTPDAKAKDFAQWLPSEILESHGRFAAIIDGTISKPNILVKSQIDPTIKLPDRKLELSPTEVVLRFDGEEFKLDRATMKDPAGEIVATGTINLKKGINVRLLGSDVDLAKIVQAASGRVDLQAQLVGTLKDPKYSGKVQGFNISYTGFPGTVLALATDFTGNKEGIDLKEIEAMEGASQITGNLGIGFSKQTLGGRFAVKGIDIRDLYSGPVAGVLDLKDLQVGGTFSAPSIKGDFEAKKILAFNFAVDRAGGMLNYDGKNLLISNGTADFAKGKVTDIGGSISVEKKTGKITGAFSKLDLNDITQSALTPVKQNDGGSEQPDFSSPIVVKGNGSGTFEVGIDQGTFASLTSKGRVDDVLLNKAFIGSGEWDAGFDGKTWSTNAFIGSLDDYFQVSNATYRPESGGIGGEFISYKVPLDQLLLAFEPSLGLTAENHDKLQLFKGKLGSLMQFSGTVNDPVVEIPDFEISSIKLGSTDLGDFSIKGRYSKDNLTFRDGLLVGPKTSKINLPFSGVLNLPENLAIPDGTARLAGSVKNKELDIQGSIFGFPVSKFQAIAPSLANVNVFVNKGNFSLKGTQEKPLLNGSIEATAAFTPDGQKNQYGILGSKLKVNSDFSVIPSSDLKDIASKVDATGSFAFNSLAGTFKGGIYLGPDFSPAGDAPISAHLALDGSRDASPFLKQLDGFILGSDGAHLSGSVDVSNTWNNYLLSGGLTLQASSLRYGKTPDIIGRPIDLGFMDLVSNLKLENDGKKNNFARLTASTRSSYSVTDAKDPSVGSLAVDVKVPIGSEKSLEGTVTAKNFGLYQSFQQGAFVRANVDTGPNGPIKLSGTLDKPKISGDLYFDEVKAIAPTLNPAKGTSEPASIDPTFDLHFYALNPMNIKASVAEVNTKGEGTLKGSLTNMKADGKLTVESGSLALPGGVVKLTPDSTLEVRYDNTAFLNRAQLIADLHGESSLTALKNGVSPERYDIFVDISGDLLGTGGLQYKATSKPGDLSQDQIMSMLGRTDILANLLQSGVNSSTQAELRNAFATYYLPGLLNGITSDVAKGFGLDYFGVDYNVFEQASLSLVKNLGSGLYLQGRRQIFQPLPGQPQAYDYRIVYRPRRGPDALRAFSFSFGMDQLRPYKLSIDYSMRIRTSKGPYQSLNLHVPSK